MRGRLAPGRTDERLGLRAAVPLSLTRAEQFDELVLEAVEHLEQRWSAQLAEVEFVVEEVPLLAGADEGADADVLADDTVPLARLTRSGPDGRGGATAPRVVIYRRPLEARALDRGDLADLVLDVVVEEVAQLLDLDPDVVDPHDEPD
ncbi:MAG: metallopeptidase family protein [Actinomycetota bacterium]|nr:metallopeptidase family protein [Actinomycetota bacterium]